MILIMLGTQNNSFHRLLEEVDKLIEKNVIKEEEVIAQVGYTKYESKNMKIVELIPRDELEKLQNEANLIITHGGVGSIISSIEKGKKVIAIPRLHEYGEHVNDHQKEIEELFNKNEYIIGLSTVEQLENAIQSIDDFSPKEYKENNKKMLNLIDNFIKENTSQDDKSFGKKIKNFCNKILNSKWFVILIGILLFGKSMLFYSDTISQSTPVEHSTIIGTISFIAIIVCFISVIPNRLRVKTVIIINVLLSILLFADDVYYTFSSSVLSLAQITNLQYGEQIANTLPVLLESKQILYFIDIIIIFVLYIAKVFKTDKCKKRNKFVKILNGAIIICGLILCLAVERGYIEKGKDKSYNKDLQISDATIFGYHISDIEYSLTYKNQARYKNYNDMITDYDKLKEDYENKYGQTSKNLENVLDRKNFIILQLESIQQFVVNKEINGKEITPNLNTFLNENIEFTNMHMQSYSTTADSEYTTITSTYPMENGMSFSKYYTNTYNNLFDLFNDMEYDTSYMHGNFSNFWNRGNVYGRMDLNDLIFKDSFEDLSENINGDLSDELLYKQATKKLSEREQPFMSYVVSASSHTPFTLDGIINKENKVNIDVGKYKNTYFGDYLEAVNYADYAFGIFIKELKNEGLYDDIGILIFGDHNGLNMYNDEMIDFLKDNDPNLNDVDIKLNYTNVLCGMKIPGVNNLKIEKPINKLDIKPTCSYLFDTEDKFSLGMNMFGTKDFVCLNNERIITDKYYYDEMWYNIQSGEEVDLDTISEDEKQKLNEYYNNMKKELEISFSINVNDLLR